MTRMVTSRRQVLQGTVAGGATALAGLSGCSLLGDDNGDSGSPVPYRTWVPGSEVFDPPGATGVSYYGFDRLREHASELPADLETFVSSNLVRFGQWGTNPETVIGFSTISGRTGIYHGSFESSSLAASMRSTDPFEDAAAHEDYEVLTERRTGLWWAVGDDAVVYAPERGPLETLLDTNVGTSPRAVEGEPFETVVDEIGTGTTAVVRGYPDPPSVRPPKPSGRIVEGERIRIDGATTTFKFVYLLNREPTDEDVTALRSAIEKRRVSDVSASRTDRYLTASGAFRTAELTRDILLFPRRAVIVFPLPGDREVVLSDDE